MTVIVDTGPLVGGASRTDPYHAEAVRLLGEALSGRHGAVLCTDLVFAEAMNLLARRPGRKEVSERFAQTVRHARSGIRWLATDAEALDEATELHLREYARGLSLTDCTVILQARRLEASVLTFDKGFQGLVPVV